MKKVYLLLSFICFFNVNAQEVILEGDFKSNYKPASVDLVSGILNLTNSDIQKNRFLLLNFKSFSDYKYDYVNSDGSFEKFNHKDFNRLVESESGNTKVLKSYNGYNLAIDESGKTFDVKKGIWKEIYLDYFRCVNVNDNYIIGLQNQKGKNEINLEKDDIYLYLYDFRLKKIFKKKMDKPNLERLKSNKNKNGFNILKVYNDKFILVTKAINEEHNRCSIYLTYYNFEGKIIDEKELKIDSGNQYLLYSNNGAGQLDYSQTSPAGNDIYKIGDEMFINDIDFDKLEKNEFFYVHGLIGDAPKKMNSKVSTKGFYVYKYDLNGNLIWKQTYDLSNSKLLGASFHSFLIQTFVTSVGNDLCFYASANRLKHYVNFSILNKKNGELKLNKEMEQNDKLKLKYFQTNFLCSGSKIDSFKDKLFDFNTISSMYNDERVLKYIKSINSSKTVLFEMINLKDIMVLIESDNKTYYKFVKFNK